MKRALLFIFSIFFIIPTFANGEQLWYSGFNGNISATGYGGIAVKDSYNFLNPAANVENIRIFSSGNISLPNWGGSFGFSTPIDLGGIFFTGTQYLSFDNTSLVNAGYGKKVRSDLSFGLEGLLSIHPTQNILGGGFRIGFLWTPDYNIKNIWGIGDFSLGAVWKTLVYPTESTSFNPTPEMLWQVGVATTIMDYDPAKWKFILDYSIGFVPLGDKTYFQTWASLGTTFTFWDMWDISVGTILGNNGLGFGDNRVMPFTLGTAIGKEWDMFSFKLSYTFGGQEFYKQPEYIHTVALEIGIGETPATRRASILSTKGHKSLTNHFSPNGDLLQDTMTFLPQIIGDNIVNWTLVIANSNNKIVRTFEEDKTSTNNAVGDFFTTYFLPVKSLYIPNQIIWDGKDTQGQYVPEDTYLAVLSVQYDDNTTIHSEINYIVVDTTPPVGILSISKPYVFLGDNPHSTLNIGQTLSSNDPWTAKLIDNSDEKVVAQWFWKKGEAPTFVEWKLDNPRRINVGYGKFSYVATSYDTAGNFTEEKITNILIETRKRLPRIEVDKKVFSPDNGDVVTITPKYGVITGLVESRFYVYNESGRKVYEYKQTDITNLDKVIIWDGSDNNKRILKDGTYVITLEQSYIDKEIFTSQALLITLDSTPPTFSAQFSPKRFSPDGDNFNDVLRIDFSAEDVHNINKWVISIQDVNDEVLCRFQGKELEKTMFWFPNRRLTSGDLLYFRIEISDELGNTLETLFHELRIDILVDDKGRIITKNEAFFDDGSGNLNRDMYPYLGEIWNYYKHNPEDKIRIVGQASLQESSNSQTTANKLSISRADAAKSYLISRGISEKNIEVEVLTDDAKTTKKQDELRQLHIYIIR